MEQTQEKSAEANPTVNPTDQDIETPDAPLSGLQKHVKDLIIALVVGVVTTLVIFGVKRMLPSEPNSVILTPSEPGAAVDTQTQRHYFVRATITSMMSQTHLLKMYITEHYMASGEFPETLQDLGLV